MEMKVLLFSQNVPPLNAGRDTLLRHSYFTFIVDGISRACSHQLVRHRVASYSQQSQRYVAMRNFPYVTPPSAEGVKVNLNGMELTYHDLMALIGSFYDKLVEMNVPAEDARFVLPNACTTRIMFTMNGEGLVHFFRLRTCTRAQWEIRNMAMEMLRILRKEHPKLFAHAGPNCYYLGYCPEGEKSCGREEEMKRLFSTFALEAKC